MCYIKLYKYCLNNLLLNINAIRKKNYQDPGYTRECIYFDKMYFLEFIFENNNNNCKQRVFI